MEHAEIISILSSLIQGLGDILGDDTELALHDLNTKTMVAIANNSVTGREPGYQLNETALSTILDLSDEQGRLIGYASRSRADRPLRSSHLLIRDSQGEAHALLCVNQALDKLLALKAYLDEKVAVLSPADFSSSGDADENYIPRLTRQMILDEIERFKPSALDSRTTKMNILRSLERKGVFAVRDAVPQVCKVLSISQATLYNYLRELRNEDEAPVALPVDLQGLTTK